ncbi:hypothetical protein GCM10007890_08120 [Methylobacterium tardum]|uniref:Uncharacterized protein n=1 Tax=Methylobacterium tardum TaxID=374432 RepID=A0AA37WPD8_9HYPH|nr:hypothetical protein GCM10007890_08120 [Methylobacterium tardum]
MNRSRLLGAGSQEGRAREWRGVPEKTLGTLNPSRQPRKAKGWRGGGCPGRPPSRPRERSEAIQGGGTSQDVAHPWIASLRSQGRGGLGSWAEGGPHMFG